MACLGAGLVLAESPAALVLVAAALIAASLSLLRAPRLAAFAGALVLAGGLVGDMRASPHSTASPTASATASICRCGPTS